MKNELQPTYYRIVQFENILCTGRIILIFTYFIACYKRPAMYDMEWTSSTAKINTRSNLNSS